MSEKDIIEWLSNPNAKPAKELSKHDQDMIQLGWDAAISYRKPSPELREKISELCSKGMRDCDYNCANCIELNKLQALIVPKDKPPLLEQKNCHEVDSPQDWNMGAEAQRETDIKWYRD